MEDKQSFPDACIGAGMSRNKIAALLALSEDDGNRTKREPKERPDPRKDGMLTRTEAIEYLRAKSGKGSHSNLSNLAARGSGPKFVMRGRRMLYTETALDEWIAVTPGTGVRWHPTSEQVETIYRMLEAGCSTNAIAPMVLVAPATLRKWLAARAAIRLAA